MLDIIHSNNTFLQEDLGKGRTKYKEYFLCKKDKMFHQIEEIDNIVIMSDIHGSTNNAIDKLIKKKVLTNKTFVISLGDMSGSGLGKNGDPYDSYVKINNIVPYFYFVQGNHDLHNDLTYELVNKDGSYCHVHNKCVKTPLGIIAGINGVIRNNSINDSLHKYSSDTYLKFLKNVLSKNPTILLTHDTLKDDYRELFKKKKKLKHFYGHCHEDEYFINCNNYIGLNCDNKIFNFI